jgi:hypothetical protein
MNKNHIQFILLGLLLSLNGCFIEDQPVAPHQPGDESYIQLTDNIYDYQIYFDLGSESTVSLYPNNHYHLAFECGEFGWIIRLNTSDNHKICRTGSTHFDEVTAIPDSADWIYDSSDGNHDSTAIGTWVDTTGQIFQYSNEVYLIGQFNGINYEVTRNLLFLSVDANRYIFRAAKLNGDDSQEITVLKSDDYDYIFYNLILNQVAEQPARDAWDFLFASYTTKLYTNDGIPTPYNVRGIFINESQTIAAMDTLFEFQEINFDNLDSLTFTTQRDIIGHDWKYYNGEDYVVRPHMNFVLRDQAGYYYKFRFTRYHNDLDVKGFPGFELQRL